MNTITIGYDPSQTPSALLWNRADDTSASIAITETPVDSGRYVVDFTSVDPGQYDLQLIDGGYTEGMKTFTWDGSNVTVEPGVDAVVDLSPLSDQLDAIQAQTDKINSSNIIVLSAIATGTVEIVQGDYYLNTDGRALFFVKPTGANWPTDLTDWTITLKADKSPNNSNTGTPDTLTFSGSVVVPAGPQSVQVEITGTSTATIATGVGGWNFEVVATKTDDKATLVMGSMTVKEKLS